MRRARFQVAESVLRGVLHMPPTSQITDISMSTEGPVIVVVADDPSLPEADEIHDTDPILTKSKTHWDWGLR